MINEVELQSSIAYFDRFIRPLISQQTIPERRFIHPNKRLAIGIDREWRAYEFHQLFDSLDYLNKLYVVQTKLRRQAPDLRMEREMTRSYVFQQARLSFYLASHEELRVRSISFASPGDINFDGLGDAIRAIQELFHYIVTFQFVRGFVDLYDHFKYERPTERSERRMKLREVIRREQSQDRQLAINELGEYREFLQKMNEIADLARQLDEKGLARGVIVEETAMKSISMLHRMGFDQKKLKRLEAPRNRKT